MMQLVLVVVDAGGDMEQVHLRREQLRDLHALVDIVAAGGELRAAHPELDREARTDRLADGVEHHQSKPAAVFPAPPETVRAVVRLGRHELLEKPAVAAVDDHHAVAAAFRKARGVRVGADDGLDDLLRHLENFHAVGSELMVRTVRRHAGAGVLGDKIRDVGVFSAVAELHGGDCPVARDGARRRRNGRHDRWVVKLELIWVHQSCRRVDNAVAERYDRRAAAGAELVERDALALEILAGE